ncbi:hypothetical protein QJS04_geneDACA013342 [Acorus gramineus]|uniref:Uncharacterized protein n=1 Tax=Acorus gramineus TaxID=55184 RepID=A0AAV9A875_ACOGR|nr:hypothetical protein QJS04_geneDACA013342 [Acorus gramineus]
MVLTVLTIRKARPMVFSYDGYPCIIFRFLSDIAAGIGGDGPSAIVALGVDGCSQKGHSDEEMERRIMEEEIRFEKTTKLGIQETRNDRANFSSWTPEQPIPQSTTILNILISCMGFVLPMAILILQSMVAIHRSRNDATIIVFIVFLDIGIALLFCSIRDHEKAPVGSKQREKHKILIWFLATLLNVGFAYRVTMMMPLVVSWVLWSLVAVTTIGTFHIYFLRPDEKIIKVRGDAIKEPKPGFTNAEAITIKTINSRPKETTIHILDFPTNWMNLQDTLTSTHLKPRLAVGALGDKPLVVNVGAFPVLLGFDSPWERFFSFSQHPIKEDVKGLCYFQFKEINKKKKFSKVFEKHQGISKGYPTKWYQSLVDMIHNPNPPGFRITEFTESQSHLSTKQALSVGSPVTTNTNPIMQKAEMAAVQ